MINRYLFAFTVLIAVFSAPLEAQPPEPFDAGPEALFERKPVNWEELELSLPFPQKKSLKTKFKNMTGEFVEEDRIHLVYLNADDKPDLIYDGPFDDFGGVMVCVWEDDKFRETGMWHAAAVSKIYTEGNRIKYMEIANYPCCVMYMFSYEYLVFNAEENMFKPLYERCFTSCMTGPVMYFPQPLRFVVKNDQYRMREQPNYGEKGCSYYEEDENGNIPQEGNIVVKYPPGIKGLAWSRFTDEKGDVWWLVEMDEAGKLEYDRYAEDGGKGHYIGWMNSTYLRVIEQGQE